MIFFLIFSFDYLDVLLLTTSDTLARQKVKETCKANDVTFLHAQSYLLIPLSTLIKSESLNWLQKFTLSRSA